MSRFVLVDGIDGSGKGVILSALREWAEGQRLKILDLKEFCKEYHTLPTPEQIEAYDAIFSSEPSYGYIGRAISEEMIVTGGREYSVLSTAWAFALDREIQYNRVIIPALKLGKYVFQERGIISSIVYQPVQGRISLKELIQMPGNRLALKHAPGLLIIARVEPRVVVERLEQNGKLNDAIFRQLNFLRTIDQRYASVWLKDLFEKFKTKVVYIDTNPPKSVDETRKETLALWEEFLKG